MTTPAPEWHGWSRGLSSGQKTGRALHIGPLPGRKSLVMYVHDGSVVRALAYFRNYQDAALALDVLDEIVGLK